MNDSFEITFDWSRYFQIDNNKILQKENNEIEFKESFHSPKSRDKKLHKWIASFANAQGGLIIYGVKNDGSIVGLNNRRLHDFDNKDLTQELLDFFAPEIRYELFIKKIESVELGFLYIYESTNKPVVAIKSADNTIQESDIFYRYPGQSKRISYPELKIILENNYNSLNEKWMNTIRNIAKIGVDNVGLLNIQDGEIIGNKKKLLIPEELLSKIKFINEGTFVEKEGAPTLKLIGDVQPIDSKNIVQIIEPKFQVITLNELFEVFFSQKLKENIAHEFFRKVLYENSSYYPIYFYLTKAKITLTDAFKMIEQEHGSKCSAVKNRLIKEAKDYLRFKNGNMDTGSDAAYKISEFYDLLKQGKKIKVRKLRNLELRHVLQAITHLSQIEIDKNYIIKLLSKIFKYHFDSNAITKTFIRQTICHVDLNLYGIEYFKTNE